MTIDSRAVSGKTRARHRSVLAVHPLLIVLTCFAVSGGCQSPASGPTASWGVTLEGSGTVRIPEAGMFAPTGSMTSARSGPTATLLEDGRVLILGGSDGSSSLASAELYDPTTGKFTATGTMIMADDSDTATPLIDGRVLVVGAASAELYDLETGAFSNAGPMASDVFGKVYQYAPWHTATLLPDGRVLVAGPFVSGLESGSLLQVYDPKTGDFGLAEPTTERSVGYISALLKDGRVLIVGGSSAELFDPATGKFRATGSMTTSRTDSTTYLKTGPTATLLKDGRVLIAGGSDGSNSLSSAELYDPATGKFGRTGSMTAGREDAVAIRLADGRVLVVGGRKVGLKVGLIPSLGSRCQALASAETYDPGTGKFSPTGWMAAGCSGYAIALLSDGRVLVAGGWDDYNNRALASAELFMP